MERHTKKESLGNQVLVADLEHEFETREGGDFGSCLPTTNKLSVPMLCQTNCHNVSNTTLDMKVCRKPGECNAVVINEMARKWPGLEPYESIDRRKHQLKRRQYKERHSYAKALLRSERELEKLSKRIRHEINYSEMVELAFEAETAANAGVVRFSATPSTFGESTSIPSEHVKKRSRDTTSLYENVQNVSQTTFNRQLKRRELRPISEVFPHWKGLHLHMRSHLLQRDVPEIYVTYSEKQPLRHRLKPLKLQLPLFGSFADKTLAGFKRRLSTNENFLQDGYDRSQKTKELIALKKVVKQKNAAANDVDLWQQRPLLDSPHTPVPKHSHSRSAGTLDFDTPSGLRYIRNNEISTKGDDKIIITPFVERSLVEPSSIVESEAGVGYGHTRDLQNEVNLLLALPSIDKASDTEDFFIEKKERKSSGNFPNRQSLSDDGDEEKKETEMQYESYSQVGFSDQQKTPCQIVWPRMLQSPTHMKDQCCDCSCSCSTSSASLDEDREHGLCRSETWAVSDFHRNPCLQRSLSWPIYKSYAKGGFRKGTHTDFCFERHSIERQRKNLSFLKSREGCGVTCQSSSTDYQFETAMDVASTHCLPIISNCKKNTQTRQRESDDFLSNYFYCARTINNHRESFFDFKDKICVNQCHRVVGEKPWSVNTICTDIHRAFTERSKTNKALVSKDSRSVSLDGIRIDLQPSNGWLRIFEDFFQHCGSRPKADISEDTAFDPPSLRQSGR